MKTAINYPYKLLNGKQVNNMATEFYNEKNLSNILAVYKDESNISFFVIFFFFLLFSSAGLKGAPVLGLSYQASIQL